MGSNITTVVSQVDESSNILLLTPAGEQPENDACIELLTQTTPPKENVLSITFTQSPDERFAIWQHRVGDTLPANANIVSLGEKTSDSTLSALATQEPESISLETIPSADNLIILGMRIESTLTAWQANTHQTRVCFHSVTALLDHVAVSRGTQLLNTFCDRFRAADAVAHYHLDPNAVDQQVVEQLRPLFDAVIEYTPGDDWTATTPTADETRPPSTGGHSPDEYMPPTGSIPTDLPPLPRSLDYLLDLMRNRQRRHILYTLIEAPSKTVNIETLVATLAQEIEHEDERTIDARRQELLTTLHHAHLPKLSGMGLIEVDSTTEQVRYTGIACCTVSKLAPTSHSVVTTTKNSHFN